MKKLAIVLILSLLFTSCELLNQVAKGIDNVGAMGNVPLTVADVISGLKDALRVSTDSAVSKVTKPNGFFNDQIIKILLPPEAEVITKNLNNPILKSVGISRMIDDVVIRLNKSAEEAAKKASPIFVNSIKSMNISDAFGILRGADTAATNYFRINTSAQLYSEFNPIVKQYLDQALIGGISTNQAWKTLTSSYNKVMQFSSSYKPISTNLDDYVTKKTINGVFIKLADTEKNIRHDPMARVTDILKRVFN